MPINFNALAEYTTEPNPDNYSYSIREKTVEGVDVVRTVVINVPTATACINGIRDFIGPKIPPGEVILRLRVIVETGPIPL